DNS
ncbi:hypothetical protein AWZ03_014171, partial [Drosophila navojoa]